MCLPTGDSSDSWKLHDMASKQISAFYPQMGNINLGEIRGSKETGSDVQGEYLDLLQEIRSSKEEMLEDKRKLEGLVNASNMLFKKIKTSSELKLDAKVTAISTKLVCSRMEKDFDANIITPKKLIELFENDLLDEFYRYGAGCSLGIRFLDQLSFVQKEEGKRKPQSQRAKLVPSEVEVPRSATEVEDGVEVLMQMKMLLEERGKVEYFRCVINPASFSKTIENIFYLSLAVRSGEVSLVYDENTLYVHPSNSSASDGEGHLVFEISYDEYLEMVERMGMRTKSVQE